MNRTLVVSLLLMLPIIDFTVTASAKVPRPKRGDTAKVTDAVGTVAKKASGKNTDWKPVSVGDLLEVNSFLRTGENSAALLSLAGNHVVRIGAQTTVELRLLGKDSAFSFNVISGKIWSFVRGVSRPAKFEVETPSAMVGVSGTVFSVFHDPDDSETMVSAMVGQVNVQQGEHSTQIAKGFAGAFQRNGSSTGAVESPMQIKMMWRMMRQNEAWMLPRGGQMKLSRQFEPQFEKVWRRRPRRGARSIRPGGARLDGQGRPLPQGPPEHIAPSRPRRPGP